MAVQPRDITLRPQLGMFDAVSTGLAAILGAGRRLIFLGGGIVGAYVAI
jgi:hypothetical protein